jgi:hypothetical protein
MGRAALEGSPDGILGHIFLLVVLLKVHTNGLVFLPLEGDTPRSVDMNRIALRPAPKRMKVEAWQIHVTRDFGLIQRVEASSASLVKVESNLRGLAGLKELLETSMSEASDHGHM